MAVGAIAGALISGWAVDYFGRKTSLLLYCVPFAAGWLLISNAKHQSMLYIGRLLTGIAVGATSQTVPVSSFNNFLCRTVLVSFGTVYNRGKH